MDLLHLAVRLMLRQSISEHGLIRVFASLSSQSRATNVDSIPSLFDSSVEEEMLVT